MGKSSYLNPHQFDHKHLIRISTSDLIYGNVKLVVFWNNVNMVQWWNEFFSCNVERNYDNTNE